MIPSSNIYELPHLLGVQLHVYRPHGIVPYVINTLLFFQSFSSLCFNVDSFCYVFNLTVISSVLSFSF